MFTKKDFRWFFVAAFLLLTGFLGVAFDPVPNGFGILTLWIAPPLLLAGFLAIVPGIAGDKLKLPSRASLTKSTGKHITGLIIFFVSLTVYLITLEPTASLWDCSEFIASSFKLQVPHTPGNPLLLLTGRVFSMLSLGDSTLVAKCVNSMSAVFSAATVTLVYFIIMDLGRKMRPNASPVIRIVAAATGSLSIAFSDTFWFSSVEAETYAASCFFLFLIVILILKGKSAEGEKRKRLLILILYLAGLSFCIHPMCLLALPVLPLAWSLEKKTITIKNILLPLLAGVAIVLFINRVIAIGIFEAAFFLDRIAVNNLNLPFYSGAVLFLGLLTFGFRTMLKKLPSHTQYLHALIFLLIGFLPYALLFLRSNHNPPIDESNPENLQLIKAYMNREGYPTRPLLFGPFFDAEITDVEAKQKVYYKGSDSYLEAGSISEYKYSPGRQTILPRIYSSDADHIDSYRRWTGLKDGETPGFRHNILFMLRYQLGHMYFRYVLFNFAGRESDEQNGAWLSPFEKRNAENTVFQTPARNQYWMIPLGLGLVGSIFQFRYDRKNFISHTTVFLMTGVFLVLYLNSTPNEPRERDYIYVGSYVAFAVWIGLGVLALASLSKPKMQVTFVSVLFVVPLWMLVENFNDHDRSGRTFQIDNARNTLTGCAPNSILFTGGDNDTFPFWYLQEVEGFRTDIRVVVLSYLNTDWYINQLRNHYYESQPFELHLDKDDYRQYGPNDILYVQEKFADGVDGKKFLHLLHEGHPALKLQMQNGEFYNSLPSRKIMIPVNAPFDGTTAEPGLIPLNISARHLYKNGLAILDLLIHNPERPVYFNFTSLTQTGLEIGKHLAQEGQLFRFRPYSSKDSDPGIDIETTYRNLVERADYSNLLDNKIYFNHEDYELRIIQPLRQSFNTLALAFMQNEEEAKAREVLDTAIHYFYQDRFKPSFANLQAANLLMNLGRKDEARKLAESLYFYNDQRIKLGYNGQAEEQLRNFAGDILSALDDESTDQ